MNSNEDFREWKSCIGLLQHVPTKYHKSWIPFDLSLTCIAAHSHFIALGTNIGLVYWYDRRQGKLMKLVCADRMTPISVVALLDSIDFMLAVGNEFGIVAIFQIPKVSGQTLIATTSEGGTDCFHIENVHKQNITCFEWSLNGQKLFSADSDGLVCLTNVDYSLRKSSTTKLCKLDSLVTQMSYHKGTLLISSLEQSYFCYPKSIHEDSVLHIAGDKPRQINGVYGGFIDQHISSSKDVNALMLRPNWTLASVTTSKEKCDSGEVKSKLSFKSRLKEPHKEITLLNPTVFSGVSNHDALNLLRMGEAMIAYNHKIFHILKIDENQVMVTASCNSLKGILGLSVTSTKEIFVLENSRSVVRIASFEDVHETSDILSKDPNVSSTPEGGPGLETLSNFLSNSGKKILNRFPKLKKLGELGELILGEVDTGEEANERSFLRDESPEDVSDEDESRHELLLVNDPSSDNVDIVLSEENVIDVLNLKEYLPVSNVSPSSKKSHPDPLVHIPIDVPIAITDDESLGDEPKTDKTPLTIEIRKDPVETTPNWTRLSGTGRGIKNFVVCSAFIIIQDDCDRSFISYRKSDFKFWILLQNFAPWDRLVLSPDGRIVWRLYKSILYSLVLKEGEQIPEAEFYNWNKISKPGVLDIFLSEHEGYMLDGHNNTLVKHSNLSSSKPFDPRHFVVRPIKEGTFRIVSVADEVLYALDKNYKYVRVYPFEDEKVSFLDNMEDKWELRRTPASIVLIKSLTSVKFVELNTRGTLHLMERNKDLSCWFWSKFLADGGDKGLIRYSEGSLWVSSGCDVYFNEGSILSNSWVDFEMESGDDIMEMHCDGLSRSGGVVWVKSGRDLHCFNPTMKSLVKVELPNKVSSPATLSFNGASIWTLDGEGAIYTREGISRYNYSGDFWRPLDTTQLSETNVRLRSISLGSSIVWAVDYDGKFYMRLGSLSQGKDDDFMPAWIAGDVEFNDRLEPIKLMKIFAAHAMHVVWAIDEKRHVYVRSGISDEFRLGSRWTKVKQSFGCAVLLAVCDFTVWVLCSDGRIWKRTGITPTCAEGQEWLWIPSKKAVFISASADGFLFVLTADGRVLKECQVEFSLRQL